MKNSIKSILLTLIALAVILAVGSGAEAASYTDTAGHWSEATVEWGTEQGITKGYPDGTFLPDASITEAEFLAMLIRTFSDTTDGNPWYEPYYEVAATLNYPVSNAPDTVILRTSVAEIVAGTQGVNYAGDNAIQYLLGVGLANGTDARDISVQNFKGDKSLTRAEAVQFIKNLMQAGITEIKARPFEPTPIEQLLGLPNNGDISPNGMSVFVEGFGWGPLQEPSTGTTVEMNPSGVIIGDM